jgi:[ribosomal protein S5]-alanine N-acetyltransferase
MKPSTISTKRLILRRAISVDSEDLFRNYTSDPECSRFLTRLPHANSDDTATFLDNWCNQSWDKNSEKFAWVVALAETNEAIGVFLVDCEGHKAQIHFGVGRQFWRQGFATELTNAAVQWLITQKNIQRVWAVCDQLNNGSKKVLENIGFQNEGVLRKWIVLPAFGGQARDCHVYSRICEL